MSIEAVERLPVRDWVRYGQMALLKWMERMPGMSEPEAEEWAEELLRGADYSQRRIARAHKANVMAKRKGR